MRLNHLNLAVPDVPRTAEFFERYLGFRCIVERGRDTLAVLLGESDFVLTISNFDKASEVHYPDAFHVGFRRENRQEVDDLYARFQADGFDAPPPREFHGAWTFYLKVPGGFVVEVFHQPNVPQPSVASNAAAQ